MEIRRKDAVQHNYLIYLFPSQLGSLHVNRLWSNFYRFTINSFHRGHCSPAPQGSLITLTFHLSVKHVPSSSWTVPRRSGRAGRAAVDPRDADTPFRGRGHWPCAALRGLWELWWSRLRWNPPCSCCSLAPRRRCTPWPTAKTCCRRGHINTLGSFTPVLHVSYGWWIILICLILSLHVYFYSRGFKVKMYQTDICHSYSLASFYFPGVFHEGEQHHSTISLHH